MNFKQLKMLFTKHLLIITLVFPLLVVIFYGITLSVILKHKHNTYSNEELNRYEDELKERHRLFLREKGKYIELFINILYAKELNTSNTLVENRVIDFIESLKKYDSGFIFVFKANGELIKHPCATRFIGFEDKYNRSQKNDIVKKFIEASKSDKYIYYSGMDCQQNRIVDKIGYVQQIRETNLYVVISKNETDINNSIQAQKLIWQKKFEDESDDNTKLLVFAIFLSIIFSLIFSKILNHIILDYEKEIQRSNSIMFAQSRLAQAGELLSMISHQWRQPISKIASIVTNLRFKIMMSAEIDKEYIDKKSQEIEEHTEFLSKTIDDFREFYKPKNLKESVYLVPLIHKAVDFLENSIKKKKIIVKTHFCKDAKVEIYPNELIQVIINIVQNAIEFSQNGATIKIITRVKSGDYMIYIKDNAGGIKSEYIDKIFDAHFSTKSAKSTNNLGLGLYVSKVIIETHFHGKLSVSSQGECSIFTIRLPK